MPTELRRVALSVWRRQITAQRPGAGERIGDPGKYLELDGLKELRGFDLSKQQEEIVQAKLLIQSKPRNALSTTISTIKVLLYVFAGLLLATTMSQCRNSESARTWFVWLLDTTGYMIMSFGTIYRSRVTNMYEQTVTYTDALVAAVRGVPANKRPKVKFNLWQVRVVFGLQILWSAMVALVIAVRGDYVERTFGEGTACDEKSASALTAHNWMLCVCGIGLVGLVVTQWVMFVGREKRLWWFYAWSLEVLEAGVAVVNKTELAKTEYDVAGVTRSFASSAQALLRPPAPSLAQATHPHGNNSHSSNHHKTS